VSAIQAPPFAARMADLGTETAFAVSQEAVAWRAAGHTVYPFRLGDMDLATPRNIVDRAEWAMRSGRTGCSFCTRLRFGRALPGEEHRNVRIAYSGIGIDLIREGLTRFKEWAEA